MSSLASHKRPEATADDFNIPQGAPTEFNLELEGADVGQFSGRRHKPADGILEATERGPDKIHICSLTQTASQQAIGIIAGFPAPLQTAPIFYDFDPTPNLPQMGG